MGNSCRSVKKNKNSSSLKAKLNFILKTYTWVKDTKGLFDYESQNIFEQTIRTNGSNVISRIDQKIFCYSPLYAPEKTESFEELSRIIFHNNNYYIYSEPSQNSEINDQKRQIYKAIRFYKHEKLSGIKIAKGDIIKLGRIEFLITEIHKVNEVPKENEEANAPNDNNLPNQAENQDKLNDTNEEIKDEDINEEEKKDRESLVSSIISNKARENACRICLSEDNFASNPLINPCKCSGSMKYIHLECLKKWFKTRTTIYNSQNAVSISIKKFECEVCKQKYTLSIEIKGNTYNLVEFAKPSNISYIVFESTNQQDLNIFNLVKIGKKTEIKIGRSTNNDLRINDISISRTHATIKYFEGSFYLEDKNSKFGSLFKVQEPNLLSGSFTNYFQSGRTLFTISFFLKEKKLKCLPYEIKLKGLTEDKESLDRSTIEEIKEVSRNFFSKLPSENYYMEYRNPVQPRILQLSEEVKEDNPEAKEEKVEKRELNEQKELNEQNKQKQKDEKDVLNKKNRKNGMDQTSLQQKNSVLLKKDEHKEETKIRGNSEIHNAQTKEKVDQNENNLNESKTGMLEKAKKDTEIKSLKDQIIT